MRVKPSLIERDVIELDEKSMIGGDGGYSPQEKSIISRDINPGL